MHILAEELNSVLKGSVAHDFLSGFGKRIYFPKGIVAQSAEAGTMASRHNATAGMAFSDNEPIELSAIRQQLPDLLPRQTVGYAPTSGDPEIRALWKRELVRKNPGLDQTRISLPIVVPGITNGIAQLADLFVEPGGTVFIPDLCWDNYELIFGVRCRAQIITYPFFSKDNGFNFNGLIEAVKTGNRGGKAVIVLNFPNNPTGYSPLKDEVKALTRGLLSLAEEGIKILTISDDAYFGLFYEEETYPKSLFTELHTLHPNILAAKVDGMTKEDFVWGFRLGFLTFASAGMDETQLKALETKVQGAIRSSVSSSSRPAMSLMIKALNSPGYYDEKTKYSAILKERYTRVKKILAGQGENRVIKPLPFNSGYFMSFYLPGGGAEELRTTLLAEYRTGVIALGGHYLRVAYASIEEPELDSLFSLIYKAAEKLTGFTVTDRTMRTPAEDRGPSSLR